MTRLIDQLDCELARRRPNYYSQLQPGIDQRSVDELQTRLTKPLPSAFVSLYEWRNGQKLDCSANLIDNWMFSPLEDVVSTKDVLDGMIGTDFEGPSWLGAVSEQRKRRSPLPRRNRRIWRKAGTTNNVLARLGKSFDQIPEYGVVAPGRSEFVG